MRRLLPAVAALVLLVASPPARSGDDEADKGGKPGPAKEAPKKEPAAGEASAPGSGSRREPDKSPGAPAPDAKKAPVPTAPSLTTKTPRTKREALLMLEHMTLSVNFDEVALRDAVTWMANVTGINMVLGPALIREGQADLVKVSLRLQKVSARQALELMADSHGLAIGFQSGVLTVTTPKEARGKPVLKMYLLSDITFPLRDFPGPDMILRSQGEEHEPEVESVTKPAFSDADDILRLIKDNVGEGTWEDEGVSASVMKEWLLVRQYEEVHLQIGKILALLRAAR